MHWGLAAEGGSSKEERELVVNSTVLNPLGRNGRSKQKDEEKEQEGNKQECVGGTEN